MCQKILNISGYILSKKNYLKSIDFVTVTAFRTVGTIEGLTGGREKVTTSIQTLEKTSNKPETPN